MGATPTSCWPAAPHDPSSLLLKKAGGYCHRRGQTAGGRLIGIYRAQGASPNERQAFPAERTPDIPVDWHAKPPLQQAEWFPQA